MADTALSLPSESIGGRRAPWSEEAELSVLGAMLIDADAVAVALELVNDAGFHREGNRRIFRAMVRLYGRGDVIDAVTLSDELKTAGELEAVGGMAYLARLVDAVPTAANVAYHCRILRDKSVLRRLISSATEIIQEAYEAPSGEVDETLDRAEQKVFEIAQAEERGGFARIKEILRSTMDRIDELTRNPGSITGVPTGFPELDRMTAGFQPADLIVLAGRPSMGKTALALNIAQHTAIDEDVPVAIFSLEMSRESLVQRMLCAESKVDSSRVRTGRLSTDDFTRLARGAGHLNTAPIWIDDTPGISPIELRAKIRRLHAEAGVGLVVLDYMQLMSGGDRAENRQQEISAISRSLKGIAKEVGVPLLALSQLSRAPEQREGNRPRLSDLRESGAIEQDADVVLFIFREEMHRKPEEIEEKGLAGKAELIVGKQRNGPTGSVDLYFHKAFTAFESVSRRAEPD
ncbi:replicative DNA helicase [Candidatus Palauibacter sp.]|uniref:replicative DNA helicase n=1 Tax=Candidatus Palauibacter sp. TaxID=3101350 RepID=UPI003B591DB7